MIAVENKDIYNRADSILKKAYGSEATFREGQYEAIEATLTKHKSLVVQKTGWGKSLIYFITSRINRDNGKGVTLVISPLLVLMENQIDAATKLGLICEVMNSSTRDKRSEIITGIKNNYYDLILITPETLFSNEFQEALPNINIGLLVVDEAHCISDWGHDFRLEYGRLSRVVSEFAGRVPILATTATANNRVIEDLKKQIGEDLFVSRGGLHRESLAIQVMEMKDRAERYAWISKYIPTLPGSGIIYCLTTRDCDYLTEFLQEEGISAFSYHSKLTEDETRDAEFAFRNNEIKVLVATIKLGMGYDKDDISFIVHFQCPSNIVSYYQQIGRAGRNIPYANIFLMYGAEDTKIQDYFIDTAFPYEDEAIEVLSVIEDNPDSKLNDITSLVNMRLARLKKTLMFLEHEGYIIKDKSKYFRTAKVFKYNEEYYSDVRLTRKREQTQIKDLINTKECYSKFIVNSLDDDSDVRCGKCTNCLGHDIVSTNLSINEKEQAARFINSKILSIIPRKMWAATSMTKYSKIKNVNLEGLCLCRWGDAGFGEVVRESYLNNTDYPDVLLDRAKEVLEPLVREHSIKTLSIVPSMSNNLIEKFSVKLAATLGLEFKTLLKKSKHAKQKSMQNSSYQCFNALSSYEVCDNVERDVILLIDDTVDSKWTLTVCGDMLQDAGATSILPFALADSSNSED